LQIRFPNVEPIRPGYEGPPIRIRYSAPFYAAEQLATGRLVAQFRPSVVGEILFEADTEDGSITREGADTIVITIPGATTANFASLSTVFFDFVRISDDGRRRVVPGQWSWPVKMSVTRNVE